ncbi:gnat family [Diplodia corticola]|uniref:Gnat family n=1 Tax=Diplodia corticola TaxID=236234 RepID=A0A1J9SBB1_9PEZI|nr:gnat family [Diplodia corticola]OJD37775.1 gnat family [Diplodia corticola]
MALTAVVVATLPKRYFDKPAWDHLVSRQKNFRLFSLSSAPEAFGSTYERELDVTWDTWESRLTNPQATTFVAVSRDPGTAQNPVEFPQLLQHDWLGQLVLFRMYQEDRAKLSANASPWTALRDDEVHYHFNAMFVMPAARGQGIARKLIEHAIAGSTPSGAVRAKYTVIVWAKTNPQNAPSRNAGSRSLERAYSKADPVDGAGKNPL